MPITKPNSALIDMTPVTASAAELIAGVATDKFATAAGLAAAGFTPGGGGGAGSFLEMFYSVFQGTGTYSPDGTRDELIFVNPSAGDGNVLLPSLASSTGRSYIIAMDNDSPPAYITARAQLGELVNLHRQAYSNTPRGSILVVNRTTIWQAVLQLGSWGYNDPP